MSFNFIALLAPIINVVAFVITIVAVAVVVVVVAATVNMRALLYMYFLFVNSFYSRFLWMVNFNLNGSAHIRAFHLCKCSASIALPCFALLDNRLSRIPCTTLFGNFFSLLSLSLSLSLWLFFA